MIRSDWHYSRTLSIRVMFWCAWWGGTTVSGQPYLDILNAGHVSSPERLARWEVGVNVPMNLDPLGTLFVISPSFEQWEIAPREDPMHNSVTNGSEVLTGYLLPLTYVRTLGSRGWKMAITAIGRYMAVEAPHRADYQMGGAIVASRVMRPTLTWKFGAYANADAFGFFMLPLLGVDWRISDRHNLFGMLPGNLTYEHKTTSWLHLGVVYKAITTSFGTRAGDFRRVEENTVGLFADLYAVGKLVVRFEGGHTALSRYRGGMLDPWYPPIGDGKYVDHNIGDGTYARLGIAYRVRLDTVRASERR